MLIPVRLFPRHISFSKQALVHRLHFLHPPKDAHGLPVTRKSQRRSMGIQKRKVIWVGPIHSQLRYRALQVCVEAFCEKIYADKLAEVALEFAVFQESRACRIQILRKRWILLRCVPRFGRRLPTLYHCGTSPQVHFER